VRSLNRNSGLLGFRAREGTGVRRWLEHAVEQPLNQILESVQGPVAKVISVIIIVITGLTLAFGETSAGFRRLIQIVFGLSIAFAASSFFLSFFQFGGGALV
jgi:type IV secretion system protein TrbC